MRKTQRAVLGAAVAAVLIVSACAQKPDASGSLSGSMSPSGSTGSSSSAGSGPTAAWRTGLGILTEATDQDRTGKINTIAAAVLLDGEGKIVDVRLDELEANFSADEKGVVTMPTDYRTKRQRGSDYPLAEVSSLKKGWAEQADAFADYLKGMTPEQVEKLETDKDGKPKEADLLSGCTIAVDRYRDAIEKACADAAALGAAKGDTLTLGVETANGSSNLTATDDQDVNAQLDVTAVALTLDSDGHVTSAVGDMTEPALTVSADGGVSAPKTVRSKREQGDEYGMRQASKLGKEWYEHSEGFCDYLKGKTAAEIAAIPTDGSDADLAALCTISVDDLQKAAAKALAER